MSEERSNYRRKYKQITVADKVEIVRRLEAGEKNKVLAADYGVTHSTITYIAQRKEHVKKYSMLLENQQGNKEKTRMDGVEDSLLEKCIFQWLTQQWALGNTVSSNALQKKALALNARLEGPSSFVASTGWVTRFKNRHGIRDLSKKVGGPPREVASSGDFSKTLNALLVYDGYDLDNVYSANEAILSWKSLPNRTFASSEENKGIVRTILEDRVTIMACTNATGTHRTKLLVIGKSEKPRCFENVMNFPVAYRGEKCASIDEQIFEDWFETEFLPSVTCRKNYENKKILLLLDNATAYPSLEKLNAIDSRCKVMHFPPNSDLIQPMNNGVIESLKTLYRKAFLRELLLLDSTDLASVVHFLSQWTILNACRALSNAWDTLDENILTNAWKIVLEDNPINLDPEPITDVMYLLNQLQTGSAPYTSDEVQEWVRVEEHSTREGLSNEEMGTVGNNEAAKEENMDEEDSVPELPKPREVLAAMETILRWYESRPDAQPADFQSLSRMRNEAIDEALADTSLSTGHTFNYIDVTVKEEPYDDPDMA